MSVAEAVARLQRGCLATTHEPISAQLSSNVTSTAAVAMVWFPHVFL